MRALCFHGVRDVRVDDVPRPEAPGPTQVLVAPRCCGICGTDLHEYVAGPFVTSREPHPLTGAQLPQILGHEFSAEVVEVGREVIRVQPGDRVAVMPLVYCGRCDYCRRGLQHLCLSAGCIGLSDSWGGIAEQALLEEYQVFRIPDNVTDEQAALVEPCAVASYGVSRGGLQPGDSVLITGAGPIGALAALCAGAMGAGAIHISEPNAARRELVSTFGLGDVLDPGDVDIAAELRRRTQGIGVDVAIECSGDGDAIDTCVRSVRRGGTIVQTGLHVAPAQVELMLLALNDLTIVGTWCYGVNDWPRVIAQIAAGRLPVERVVTCRTTISDAEDAFIRLASEAPPDMKVLVTTGEEL